jgi:hypothetical protein
LIGHGSNKVAGKLGSQEAGRFERIESGKARRKPSTLHFISVSCIQNPKSRSHHPRIPAFQPFSFNL